MTASARPSTPRSARSVSVSTAASSTSSRGVSPEILTPGRKIRALLAAFDSDSDSDTASGSKSAANPAAVSGGIGATRRHAVSSSYRQRNNGDEAEKEHIEEDDADILVPKGRIAARLQQYGATAQSADHGDEVLTRNSTSNEPRVTTTVVANTTEAEINFSNPGKISLRASITASADEASTLEEDQADEDSDALPAVRMRRVPKKTARSSSNDSTASERSLSLPRSISPLFVSPSHSPSRNSRRDSENPHGGNQTNSDDDRTATVQGKANPRFLALVAQKRKEREEREKKDLQKKMEKAQQAKQFSSEITSADEIGDDIDDQDSGRKLTQQSRPARKASKKALEEMNRETQRISRNMQLTHQAITKKKITKESFFARFNSNVSQQRHESKSTPAPDSSSATAGSENPSDVELQKLAETPQTSPMLGAKENVEKIPDVSFELLPDFTRLQKSNERPVEAPAAKKHLNYQTRKTDSKSLPPKVPPKPSVRVRLSRQEVAQHQKEDSDSELEVVTSPAKCRRIAAFENLPAGLRESNSLLKLKTLAHISETSPLSISELSAQLLFQAKQQAAKERLAKLQELREKGVVIETAEERAAMEEEVENLMEKARKEGEEIAKREKNSSKQQQQQHEEPIDEEDGEDYEYSGSSDEDIEEGDQSEEEAENDNAIESQVEDGNEPDADFSDGANSDGAPVAPRGQRTRLTRVISDDEDEHGTESKTPTKLVLDSPKPANRPYFPGTAGSGNDESSMGLTQAFAGTLGENQADAFAFLPSIPDLAEPPLRSHAERADSQVMVIDSQECRTEDVDLLTRYVPSTAARVSESPARRSVSQFSSIPDPTQDAGFMYSPFDPTRRFLENSPPHGTVDTVMVSQRESPVAYRKGKLHRGRAAKISDAQESAFGEMKKAAKRLANPFDKSKSEAKEIVEEAAVESDDEYAGIGGASDEESGDDEYDQEMIDDDSGEVVDEKELAALNAMHQRSADEKQVEKLLRDITTGALRRRRGAGDDDFDLDDSDDELQARRRRKQREFAKMRKALLADEKIGELAEDPKKAAFFRAIEDRNADEDFDLGFLETEDIGSKEPANEHSQESNSRKRPLEDSSADDASNIKRPPPHLRRTTVPNMSKKPASLAEIRETLSFLTETAEYDSFQDYSSLDDNDMAPQEDENSRAASTDELSSVKNPRRTTRGPIVDRLALLRQASSNSASNHQARLAFHAGLGADSISRIGFRPPPMLRRSATSSSSTSSSSSSSAWSSSKSTVSKPSLPGVSLGTKGSVNYYTAAREREREREREMRSRKHSGGSNILALLNQRAGSGLGALGGGNWE